MKIVLSFLMTMALTLFLNVGFASDVIVKKAKVSIEKMEKIPVDSVIQLNYIEVIKFNAFVNSDALHIKHNCVNCFDKVDKINKPLAVNHKNKLKKKKILYSLNEHRAVNMKYLNEHKVITINSYNSYKRPYLS